MTLSEQGTKFLQQEEGCKLKAYRDSAGVPTIGYGNTYYEDGTKVKIGDEITQERADALFNGVLKEYEQAVNVALLEVPKQNEFDALVSLAYNIGAAAFKRSTLVKYINSGVSDYKIRQQFLAWRYSAGEPILLGRRKREADLYFSDKK